MVLEPIYLDLSSSDDDDDDHRRAGSTALMYLSKGFHMDADDDDDDVIIIDKPKTNAPVRRNRTRVIRSALDDDECCILDKDPGADATPDIVSSLDTDELVMTGEKGPVACRDFPHARYLCVHFPFKTTLHSKFCAQCHCYVCDSLAPCSLWGEGNNPNDHCHASEEPRWKTLRKIAKCGSVPSLPTGAAGGSKIVQSSILQHTAITSPATQSPVGTPVGSGVSCKLQATMKRDPLVITLKSKGRGKPSQPPRLGVRSSRPHRILPLSSFPGHRNRSPLSRPTSTPSGRLQEMDCAISTTAQPPQHPSPSPRIGSGCHPGNYPHPPRPTSAPWRVEEMDCAISTAAQSPQPPSRSPRIGSPPHPSYNPHPPKPTSAPWRVEEMDCAISTAAQSPQPPSRSPRIGSPPHPSYNPHPPRPTSTPWRVEEMDCAISTAAQSPQPPSRSPRIGSPPHPSYNPHPPRPTSTPWRLEEVEFLPVLTATQSPHPNNPNPGFGIPGAGETVALISPHPRPIANHNPLPGSAGAGTTDFLARNTRPPGAQPSQPAPDFNAAPYHPTSSPPVPKTPPSHTSPPPLPNGVCVLRPPGADATVPGFVSPAPPVPDTIYIPASALRDQEVSDVNTDLTISPQPQAVHKPGMIVDTDDVDQRFISPVNSAHNASSSHTVDNLAGPIQGWEVHGAVEFGVFTAGISDEGPRPEQQGPTSLNDVLQQMAGDDYLWEQFTGW